MGHRCKLIRGGPKGVKHKWAWVIASKPFFSIVFQADRGDRTKLLPLFDSVQALSGVGSKRRRQDRAIAKGARSDFIPSADPSQDQVASQHRGDSRDAR